LIDNPFRDSSAGVQLFPFPILDSDSCGFSVLHVFGFVEELVVGDDPEFLKYRQASRTVQNEIRQSLLYLLDSSVRRRICKKVLEMGGNAVLSYCQSFDMEGDSGLVARAYGTCVYIERCESFMHKNRNNNVEISTSSILSRIQDEENTIQHLREQASEKILKHISRDMEQEEVQLLTLRDFDSSVRVRYGGLVTARSVKYLGKLKSNLSDQETRDGWWSELRDEIRSHARTLCCTHVIVSFHHKQKLIAFAQLTSIIFH